MPWAVRNHRFLRHLPYAGRTRSERHAVNGSPIPDRPARIPSGPPWPSAERKHRRPSETPIQSKSSTTRADCRIRVRNQLLSGSCGLGKNPIKRLISHGNRRKRAQVVLRSYLI
jgi:hypothetical protein